MSLWKVSLFRQIGGLPNPAVDQLLGSDTIENLVSGWDDRDAWGGLLSHTSTPSAVTWDSDLQAIRFTGYVGAALRTSITIDPLKTYFFSADVKVEDNSPSGASAHGTYIGGHREDENNLRTTRNYDYSIKSGWEPTEGIWYNLTKTWTPGIDVRYSAGWKAQLYSPPEQVPSGPDAVTKYWWPGGLWNYYGATTSKTVIKNMFIGILDWNITTTSLSENRHTIYAIVYDIAGNISTQQIKQIIILPDPFKVSSGIDWQIGEIGTVTIGECN